MLGLEGSDDDSMGNESKGRSNISDDGGSSDDDSSNGNGGSRSNVSKENDAILIKDKTKRSTPSSSSSTDSESDDGEENGGATSRQVTFVPGKRDLEDRIRSRISQRASDKRGSDDRVAEDGRLREEPTPFQKYLERRREKRRERRRAARGGGKDASNDDGDEEEDDDRDAVEDCDENGGMYGADPEFGTAEFSDEEGGFFLSGTTASTTKKEDKGEKGKKGRASSEAVGDFGGERMRASTKEELELLVAGDDDVENDKDYDMRGLARLERDSAKRLRGERKRRHDSLAANVSGRDFRIDAADGRFAALLDGDDDGRFGIDSLLTRRRKLRQSK